MGFEVYVPRRRGGKTAGTSRKKLPAIRLSKNSLVINKWAREFFRAANIELAFDPETRTIRIGPGGTMTLKNSKVFAKGFFKAFGITATGWFPVELADGHLFAKIS